MLSSQLRNNAEGDMVNAHVLVFGSIYAMDKGILGNPNIANSDYFLDLLASLTGREDQVYILDKTIGFSELTASFLQIIVLTVVFMGLLPLAVFGAGIAVWLSRRHK